MTEYTITIPDWLPTSDNIARGNHWSKVAKAKRSMAQIIGVYANKQGIPKATTKRIVEIILIIGIHKKGRKPDATNFYKLTLDSLVSCKLLVDDNSTWMEHKATRIEQGEHDETLIKLTDVQQFPTMWAEGVSQDLRVKPRAKRKRSDA